MPAYLVTARFQDHNQPDIINAAPDQPAAIREVAHLNSQFAGLKSITITAPNGDKHIYTPGPEGPIYQFTVPPLTPHQDQPPAPQQISPECLGSMAEPDDTPPAYCMVEGEGAPQYTFIDPPANTQLALI